MSDPGHKDGPAGVSHADQLSDTVSLIATLLSWLTHGPSLAAKILRFGLVGAASGLIFAIATTALIKLGSGEKIASVLAYIVSMPVNFVGNRSFAFRSQGPLLGDVMRFCAVHVANMAVTAGAMGAAVNALGLHYGYGIAGAILLVPTVNFMLMNLWVFRRREAINQCQSAGRGPDTD